MCDVKKPPAWPILKWCGKGGRRDQGLTEKLRRNFSRRIPKNEGVEKE